jgi:hypothetical protein
MLRTTGAISALHLGKRTVSGTQSRQFIMAATIEDAHRKRLREFERQRVGDVLSQDEIEYLLSAAPVLRDYSEEKDRINSRHAKATDLRQTSSFFTLRDFAMASKAACKEDNEGLGTINLRYTLATADPRSAEYMESQKLLIAIERRKQTDALEKGMGSRCDDCGGYILSNADEGTVACEDCGGSWDSLDCGRNNLTYEQEINRNVTASFSYKRAVHLIEWMNQILGKETTKIPAEVIDSVRAEFKKARISKVEDITPQRVRAYLKKLNLSKYYEHSVSICRSLGVDPPKVTPDIEEKVKVMFQAVHGPFKKHAPAGRSNFLSYSYILYKFFELLGQDHILPYLPLLKSRQKLRTHDCTWHKICKELSWQYIPTSN